MIGFELCQGTEPGTIRPLTKRVGVEVDAEGAGLGDDCG